MGGCGGGWGQGTGETDPCGWKDAEVGRGGGAATLPVSVYRMPDVNGTETNSCWVLMRLEDPLSPPLPCFQPTS